MKLHHVQVSCPVGGEQAAREFYGDGAGAVRGGQAAGTRDSWWRLVPPPGLELHVGVEEDFTPARKAHPAFVVDNIDAVASAVDAAGFRFAGTGTSRDTSASTPADGRR
jgi:hypothetical protein